MATAEAFLAVYEPFWRTIDVTSPDRLDAHAPGEAWSVMDVIAHLLDAEVQTYTRLRTILADEEPQLVNYDEARWTKALPRTIDLAEARLLVMGLRRANAALIQRLSPEELQRTGRHNLRGDIVLGELIEIYTNHVRVHLRQVNRILEAQENGNT